MEKYNLKLIFLSFCVMLTLAGCASLSETGAKKEQQDVASAEESGPDQEVAEQGASKQDQNDGEDATGESTIVTEVEDGKKKPLLDENVVRNRIGPDPVAYDEEELIPQDDGTAVLYYFEALDEEEQKIYQEIYLSLTNREEAVVSTLDTELLDKVYQCVMLDHPEIFYSSGYVCTKHMQNDKLKSLTFYAKYDLGPEEENERQKAIDEYTKTCLSGMPQEIDQFGQIKYIYDYIIEHTRYDLNAGDNQNICSVFINGASVCQGYAEATQYLLRQLGYEITIVTGKAEGGSHAWNLVKADGNYYYLDTTWGDVDYQTMAGEDELLKNMPVNYDYFLITTSQLSKTHTIDTKVPMPACVSMDDNYYVRTGTYFTAMDEGKIAECFQKAALSDANTVTLKADSDGVFGQLKKYLLDEQRIFDYVNATDSVSYYEDSRMNTICFWLKR